MMRRDRHSFDIRILDDFPFKTAFSRHFRHFVLILMGLLLTSCCTSFLLKTLILTYISIFLFKICNLVNNEDGDLSRNALSQQSPATRHRRHLITYKSI